MRTHSPHPRCPMPFELKSLAYAVYNILLYFSLTVYNLVSTDMDVTHRSRTILQEQAKESVYKVIDYFKAEDHLSRNVVGTSSYDVATP